MVPMGIAGISSPSPGRSVHRPTTWVDLTPTLRHSHLVERRYRTVEAGSGPPMSNGSIIVAWRKKRQSSKAHQMWEPDWNPITTRYRPAQRQGAPSPPDTLSPIHCRVEAHKRRARGSPPFARPGCPGTDDRQASRPRRSLRMSRLALPVHPPRLITSIGRATDRTRTRQCGLARAQHRLSRLRRHGVLRRDAGGDQTACKRTQPSARPSPRYPVRRYDVLNGTEDKIGANRKEAHEHSSGLDHRKGVCSPVGGGIKEGSA